ncbi:MAG TPA: hypothetical protein VHJ82_06915 [Actinomycetota bacterium]|nr:hypothetical protein [Actinomycetota bacterium]
MKILRVSAALVATVLLSTAQTARAVIDEHPPGPGYFASDNVEWITTLPIETDSSGARLLDEYLYITTARWLAIYDVSNPTMPERLGTAVLPQQPQFSEEDVDTNGKILLIGTLGNLYVYDVEEKTNPTQIGMLPGADQHTISCILDCRYGYGSGGLIIDLRDPTNPKEVGNWGDGMPASSGHDVTEVAPGLVVTSTNPMMLLDARKNPVRPRLLALGPPKDDRFIHSNAWPQTAKDKFLLVGGETGGPFCGEEDAGAFMTWDTTGYQKTHTFRMIDEYRVTDGLPTDGNATVHTFCTHWFEVHPKFRNGGLVAMAWYEHGTRFLRVSKKGRISEDGYFLPVGGATSAAYWINEEIVYAVDYQRGIDILRYTGKP